MSSRDPAGRPIAFRDPASSPGRRSRRATATVVIVGLPPPATSSSTTPPPRPTPASGAPTTAASLEDVWILPPAAPFHVIHDDAHLPRPASPAPCWPLDPGGLGVRRFAGRADETGVRSFVGRPTKIRGGTTKLRRPGSEIVGRPTKLPPRHPTRAAQTPSPPVDVQLLTRDEPGAVGGEEADRLGDVVGGAEPAQRCCAGDRQRLLRELAGVDQPGGHPVGEHAGSDGVDADAVPASSAASARTIASTAALGADESLSRTGNRVVAAVETATTEPWLARRCGSAGCTTAKNPAASAASCAAIVAGATADRCSIGTCGPAACTSV